MISLPARVGTKAAGGGEDENARFIFSAVSIDNVSGDQIILSGAGRFNAQHVEGGGAFTHFQPTGMPPFPIVAHGTWRARELLSFTEVKGSPYGEQISGILTMTVELRPVGGRRVEATMDVVCNVPPGGLFTGEDEGVTLALVGGPTFVPSGTGVTLFNPGRD